MLDINIYNAIYEWSKSKLEHSFAANSADSSNAKNSNIDIYREIMPPSKTQAIVISKNSFGNTVETYIDGSSLASCQMSIVAVQKIGSHTDYEMINTIDDLEKAILYMLECFENADKPSLATGYNIKNMKVLNNASLKLLDINTLVYSIDIEFNIACQNNL